MARFVLRKVMDRHLTVEEKAEILEFMKAKENCDMPLEKVVTVFEEKYKIPITLFCLHKIILSEQMGLSGR